MKRSGVFLLLCYLALIGDLGCARRAGRGLLPNLIVPVNCASQITLVECDAHVSPPKCRSARVTYRRGCEQVVVTRK